jgi:DNA-binding MarR family transcriptional regulator
MVMQKYLDKAEENRILLRGYRAIQEFRKVDQELPPQVMLIFMLIAMEGEMLQADLSHEIKVSTSSGSRAVRRLIDRTGEYGALVSEGALPRHARYKTIALTAEGVRLKDKLVQALR